LLLPRIDGWDGRGVRNLTFEFRLRDLQIPLSNSMQKIVGTFKNL
jgi:hypothetical protein